MWNTPWLGVKYERLNYLVISYEEGHALQTVVLTPVPAGANSATAVNSFVGDWHDAVLGAIRNLGLALPQTASRGLLLTGVQDAWLRVILPLLGVALLSLLATVLMPGNPNPWLLLGTFVPAAIIGLLSIGYFQMNAALKQGRLEQLTSDELPFPDAQPAAPQPSSPATLSLKQEVGTPGLGRPAETARAQASAGRPRPGVPPHAGFGSWSQRAPFRLASRLSWKAVASVVCSIPSWLFALGLLGSLYDSLGPDGLPPHGFNIRLYELLVLGTGGLVGIFLLVVWAAWALRRWTQEPPRQSQAPTA